MTPTQRSLLHARQLGYQAAVVEKWVPAKAGGFRSDMFGIIDLVCINADATLGIQSCGQAWSAHLKKLQEEADAVRHWLACPARKLELWAWVKRKPRGKRARWHLRRGVVYLGSAFGHGWGDEVMLFESEQEGE